MTVGWARVVWWCILCALPHVKCISDGVIAVFMFLVGVWTQRRWMETARKFIFPVCWVIYRCAAFMKETNDFCFRGMHTIQCTDRAQRVKCVECGGCWLLLMKMLLFESFHHAFASCCFGAVFTSTFLFGVQCESLAGSGISAGAALTHSSVLCSQPQCLTNGQ